MLERQNVEMRKDKEAQLAAKELALKERQKEDAKHASAAAMIASSLASPLTECAQAQTQHKAAKSRLKSKPIQTTARLVFVSQSTDADVVYEEDAKSDGCTKLVPLDLQTALDALRNGLLLVEQPDGSFATSDSEEPWQHANYWRSLAAKMVLERRSDGKAFLKNDGGVGFSKVGAGTYNIVVTVDRSKLPNWMPPNTVVRITRTDHDSTNDVKYGFPRIVAAEAANAIFASRNNIGVRTHAIACYEAFRDAGRVRWFGSMHAVERAHEDLYRTLENNSTRTEGVEMAKLATDLIYRASRCGVAFFDIKPANILVFESADGTRSLRFTDFDANFFVVAHDRDWQSLMLLNLALLSAHVRNSHGAHVVGGWVSVVKPVLDQLTTQQDRYDGAWLFAARIVRVPFEDLHTVTTFGMQRLFVQMATSYFYPYAELAKHQNGGRKTRAQSWRWGGIVLHQQELNVHWKDICKINSWPTHWATQASPYAPLIMQLVDFAITTQ